MAGIEVISLGTLDYAAALAIQKERAAQRRAGAVPDALLVVEHPPVYTVGRNGEARHLGGGEAVLRGLGADYHDVDRGGSVTFHGPGQVVVYPIVSLAELFPIPGAPEQGDVIAYLRALESALLETVAGFGIEAVRRPPYTGVWMQPRDGKNWEKLAAIGVKLASGVTTHGVALNVDTDLLWFSHIVPCGIDDGGVTSMADVLGTAPTWGAVASRLAGELAIALGATLATRSALTPTR